MSLLSVTVDGMTFSDPPVNGWALLDLGGWFDGPPVRSGTAKPRPGRHGSFPEQSFRDGRVVTVDGLAPAGNRARISAVLADGMFDDISVTEPDGRTTTASVQISAGPMLKIGRSGVVRCHLEFYAPDPLRYADPVSVWTTFPTLRGGLSYDLYTDGAGTDLGYLDYGLASDTGRVVVTNTGTAPAPVSFQVDGAVDSAGFDIAQVGSDLRLRFEGPVATGSALVLDGSTGNVLIDGTADRAGQLTYRDWPVVPPGASLELAFIPLGVNLGAQLTAIIRPGSW